MRVITYVMILMSFCQFAYAKFELRADVSGTGEVVWDNLTQLASDEMVPTQWQMPSATLLPVKEWVPATFITDPTTNVSFSSGDGNSSSNVAIEVLGLQYNTSGIASTVGSSNMASGCSKDQIDGDVITLLGSTCTSKNVLENDVAQAPFLLYRPVVNIKNNDIVSAFTTNHLSAGTYTAYVPISVKVPYYIGDVLTHRVLVDSLIIMIQYEPTTITDVQISNQDIDLIPTYDALNQTISATTVASDITITGYFDNGLVFELNDASYELEHESSSATIPYNIVACASCTSGGIPPVHMAQDGTIVNRTLTFFDDGQVRTSASMHLDIGYYNVDGTNLVSGKYTDTINVTLRVGI